MGGVRYRGQVLSIDRANRLLTARLWGEVIEGVRYSSHPESRAPWPLCDAWFEQQGAVWRCVRPIGHRRVLFHDDFTRVSSPNGDTPWVVDVLSGSFTMAAVTGVANGAARLTAASGSGFLRKDYGVKVPVDEPRGLLLTARLRSIDAPMGSGVSETVSVGWTSDSASAPPFASVDVGMINDETQWYLSANNQFGAGGIVEIEGTEQTTDWKTVDVLLTVATGASGSNHAVTGYASVDGSTLTLTDSVGGSGAGSAISVSPIVFVVGSSTTVRADVDYVTAAVVDLSRSAGQ